MSLLVTHSITKTREIMTAVRKQEHPMGLVPTMGALHAGHKKLIQVARRECNWIAVSIFVNPAQFGPAEDFRNYPRDPVKDLAICRELGVDLVFEPTMEEMYPPTYRTYIEVNHITAHLCGYFRPGHFRGVATVVLKLLNILEPNQVYFGEKDAQQTAMVRQLVEDLNIPVQIRQIPTVRDSDGLAVSSRNRYLNPRERQAATSLFRALRESQRMVAQGVQKASTIRYDILQILEQEPLVQVEYLELVDPENMQPVSRVEGTVRVAAAIRLNGTRLIDNLLCEPLKTTN